MSTSSNPHGVNRARLFLGSCMALITTSITFAIRAQLETIFGPNGIGLSLEDIGYAFTPAFWGFTLAMLVGGPLVDKWGMKKIVYLAFASQLVGIVLTMMADSMPSLFVATVFVGVGNGMVEATFNPLVASMYPQEKTKMLNRFHVWFPGGIVIGSVMSWFLVEVLGLDWQWMVGVLFLPLLAYAVLLFGQKFPPTERVEMGISYDKMWSATTRPLFIVMVLCMLLTASTELGTNQRISSLLGSTVSEPLLVLAFINGIMVIGRGFAGHVVHRLKPYGMLLFSAIFSFLGLWLLTISSGAWSFLSAGIFAMGVTFFWPTMLSFVAEYIPQTGALGLSIMGGAGMLSVAIVLPVLGRVVDTLGASQALRIMSTLPLVLIVVFGVLSMYMRKYTSKKA